MKLNWMAVTIPFILVACSNSNGKNNRQPTTNNANLITSEHAKIKRAAMAKMMTKLYLRGSFSLWDYEPRYKLNRIDDKLYAAAVQLEQNQTVELMFSAIDASQAYANCGYLNSEHYTLMLGRTVKASCSDIVLQNFQFKPPQTATYEFFIQFHPVNAPKVYVKKAF